MKRLFPIPDPIIVPDGTKLSEIIGSRILGELGERVSDGLSVAQGVLPAGTISKVHVHPVVWHFTWVTEGELTVKMKDDLTDEPYELTVPVNNGVFTERGTFFQLINRTDCETKVLYIVGPGFVFEQQGREAKYNDAVVFDENWDELKEANWSPESLPTYREQNRLRHESLRRLAGDNALRAVHGELWNLKNCHGDIAVPSLLHNLLVKHPTDHNGNPVKGALIDPEKFGEPSANARTMICDLLVFLQTVVGLETDRRFSDGDIEQIVTLKCAETPSVLAEYELAYNLYKLCKAYVFDDEVWQLLLFGNHRDLSQGARLSRVRMHVFYEILDFAVTIGGGFQSAGAMENYRAFKGGIYTDPKSYRHLETSQEVTQ